MEGKCQVEIDSAQWRQTVREGALALGLKVSPEQARLMGRHAKELLHWNRTINLTAINDPLEMAVKHYVDALASASWIPVGARMLDAGSGGGFPGVPLKILRPDLSVTLVDSVRKKVSFLKHAIRTLELKGIDAVHGRLEDLGNGSPYQGKYDQVVCRAFAALDDFVRLTLPFLSAGGSLLALKGRDPGVDPVNANGGIINLHAISLAIQIHRYRLPLLNAERCLVRLTPTAAPRPGNDCPQKPPSPQPTQ
jgi:16S rRNA (guanine527-N7)-methyltransferase